MKKMILFMLMIVTCILCSCSMPSTSVRTVDDRPTLAFRGVPEGALLFVDDLNMGAAGQYDGELKALKVEPGTHVVRIISGNEVLYEQRVFLESSLKTITVR
jgi:hypothetical protein